MNNRRLGSIARQLRHNAWHSPFLPLLTVAALMMVFAPCQPFTRVSRAERPRFTQAQKRIVRKFEKELQTTFKSKDNPADRDTWYVIVFIETAVGARQSRSVSGNTLTITRELQAARNGAVKMTQGREEAAVLLVQYYTVGNSAAVRLRPTAGGSTDRAAGATAKYWRYWAFAKEDEAKALVDLIKPPKKRR